MVVSTSPYIYIPTLFALIDIIFQGLLFGLNQCCYTVTIMMKSKKNKVFRGHTTEKMRFLKYLNFPRTCRDAGIAKQ